MFKKIFGSFLNDISLLFRALLAIFTFLMILGSSVTAFKYFQEKMIWPEATLIVNSTEHAQIVGHSDSLKKKDLDSGLEYPHDTSSNGL